jgi:hypothetical protein
LLCPGGIALGAFLEQRRPAKRSIATTAVSSIKKQFRILKTHFKRRSPNPVLSETPHPIKDR